ncbi:MAG: hypothetical protein AAAFM81_14795, partial [Pseudomonadota bacterium]
DERYAAEARDGRERRCSGRTEVMTQQQRIARFRAGTRLPRPVRTAIAGLSVSSPNEGKRAIRSRDRCALLLSHSLAAKAMDGRERARMVIRFNRQYDLQFAIFVGPSVYVR